MGDAWHVTFKHPLKLFPFRERERGKGKREEEGGMGGKEGGKGREKE